MLNSDGIFRGEFHKRRVLQRDQAQVGSRHHPTASKNTSVCFEQFANLLLKILVHVAAIHFGHLMDGASCYLVFPSIISGMLPALDLENRGDAFGIFLCGPGAGAQPRGSCRCRAPSYPSAIIFKIYGDGKGLRCSSLGVFFPCTSRGHLVKSQQVRPQAKPKKLTPDVDITVRSPRTGVRAASGVWGLGVKRS